MPTAPRADSLPPLQRGGADLRSTSGPLGLSAAYLDERDEALVLEVLRSGRLASGPMSDRFERALAERLYGELAAAGLDVLYDDRDLRPGEKFVEAELLGCPLRVVAGKRSLESGELEVQVRRGTEKRSVPIEGAAGALTALLRELP